MVVLPNLCVFLYLRSLQNKTGLAQVCPHYLKGSGISHLQLCLTSKSFLTSVWHSVLQRHILDWSLLLWHGAYGQFCVSFCPQGAQNWSFLMGYPPCGQCSPSLDLVVSSFYTQFRGQVLPPFTLPIHDLMSIEPLYEVGLLTLSVERLVVYRL